MSFGVVHSTFRLGGIKILQASFGDPAVQVGQEQEANPDFPKFSLGMNIQTFW